MTKPTKTFRAGLVKAAVFEREVQGPNGPFKSQSVALQTSYQKDGEWVNKNLTLIKKDLQNSIEVLKQAAEHISSPQPEDDYVNNDEIEEQIF